MEISMKGEKVKVSGEHTQYIKWTAPLPSFWGDIIYEQFLTLYWSWLKHFSSSHLSSVPPTRAKIVQELNHFTAGDIYNVTCQVNTGLKSGEIIYKIISGSRQQALSSHQHVDPRHSTQTFVNKGNFSSQLEVHFKLLFVKYCCPMANVCKD